MIWLLAATVLATLAFFVGIIGSHHVTEWHHAYLGLPFAVLACVGVLPLWAGWCGFVVLIDDAVQHLFHASGVSTYRSPLHLAYRHLLYNPINRLRR